MFSPFNTLDELIYGLGLVSGGLKGRNKLESLIRHKNKSDFTLPKMPDTNGRRSLFPVPSMSTVKIPSTLPGDAILRTIGDGLIDLVYRVVLQVNNLKGSSLRIQTKNLRGDLNAALTAAASPKVYNGDQSRTDRLFYSIFHSIIISYAAHGAAFSLYLTSLPD